MKVKGSYTVEAAWIVSICILTIMLVIKIGFGLYVETNHFIEKQCTQNEIDMVQQFRNIAFGKDIYEKITE